MLRNRLIFYTFTLWMANHTQSGIKQWITHNDDTTVTILCPQVVMMQSELVLNSNTYLLHSKHWQNAIIPMIGLCISFILRQLYDSAMSDRKLQCNSDDCVASLFPSGHRQGWAIRFHTRVAAAEGGGMGSCEEGECSYDLTISAVIQPDAEHSLSPSLNLRAE